MAKETMQAVVLTAPGRIESQSLPVPQVGPSELLVKVFATGVCGSDLAVYRGAHPYKTPPVVLGHELAGMVVRVGKDVSGFAPGDRVCAASFSHCESCSACRRGETHLCEQKTTLCHNGWDGSFAEYVLLKQNMAFSLPGEVDWQLGALVEPLSIGLHAVRIAARGLGSDRSMAILGSGNIGLCCLLAAGKLGFRAVCTDVRTEAGRTARTLGAASFVDARREDPVDGVSKALGGSADAVVVAADYATVFEDAFKMAAPGGPVVAVSYFENDRKVPLNSLVTGEHAVIGSALSTATDIEEVLGWLASREIDPRPLIAHTPSLEGIASIMALMDSGMGRIGKAVVDVSGSGKANDA